MQYELLRAGDVSLALMDLQGRVVREQHIAAVQAGMHTVALDLDGLSAGVFFLQMTHLGKMQSRKLVLLGH